MTICHVEQPPIKSNRIATGRPRGEGIRSMLFAVHDPSADIVSSGPPLEGRLGAGPAISELTRFQCCWPIGAADSDEFHFCAEPADPTLSPRYCATHRAQALSRRSVAMSAPA